MLSKWPEFTEEYDFAKEEKAVETIKEAVRNIRNIRSEMNVAPSKKAKVFVVSSEEEIKNIFENGKVCRDNSKGIVGIFFFQSFFAVLDTQHILMNLYSIVSCITSDYCKIKIFKLISYTVFQCCQVKGRI